MSRAIWKYPLTGDTRVALEMPIGARVLAVQMQGHLPCLWALVDTSADVQRRTFRIFGTGHRFDLSPDAPHIGTFQDGPFVWHLFEATL